MKPKPRPPECSGCPAHENGHAVGYVPPSGDTKNPQLVLIGHGPDETAVRFAEPFSGRGYEGRMMNEMLRDAGVSRGDCLLTDITRCWLPARWNGELPEGRREAKPAEVRACAERHLTPLLENLTRGAVLVPVGASATKAVLGIQGGVEKYVGTFTEI